MYHLLLLNDALGAPGAYRNFDKLLLTHMIILLMIVMTITILLIIHGKMLHSLAKKKGI